MGMTIKIEDKNFKYEVTGIDTKSTFFSDVLNQGKQLYNAYLDLQRQVIMVAAQQVAHKPECTCSCHCHDDGDKDIMSPPTISYEVPKDDFKFKDRLPNEAVDLSKLNIKKAVHEEVLIRCPNCGQAHALILKTDGAMYLLRRNFAKNNFEVVMSFNDEEMLRKVSATFKDNDNLSVAERKLDYFKWLQSCDTKEALDVSADDTSEFFCPVCHESDTFAAWKHAWRNPETCFGSKNLCDVCGNVLYTNVSRSNNGELTTVQEDIYCPECGYKPAEVETNGKTE